MTIITTNIGDGHYTELIMGQSPKGDSYNKDSVGLPFYQGAKDFGEFNPSPKVWCTSPKKIAIKNDILLGVRAPVGDVNIALEKSAVGRGVAIIRCKNIDHNFIFYLLKAVKKLLNRESTGSTVKSISREDILSIKFKFPEDKKKQKSIIDKFKKKNLILNDLENELKKLNDNIDIMESTILSNSFGINVELNKEDDEE